MGLPIVEGDLTQIRQIIMNLVLNGAEATEGKAGVIRVTTGVMDADAAYLATTHLSPDLPEGRYVFLEVADNGRGMSPDTLARIFDPFFSTKFTGRGLGLAAVLGIVRAHNGALKVESHEDVGTTFRLLLPASTVVASAETTVVEPAPIWHGRGLALVVDDEPSVRHVATRMLVSMGLDVETAASGAEAIEILGERPAAFTVVLLDLTMPGSRGDETYRDIRAIRADVPIHPDERLQPPGGVEPLRGRGSRRLPPEAVPPGAPARVRARCDGGGTGGGAGAGSDDDGRPRPVTAGQLGEPIDWGGLAG